MKYTTFYNPHVETTRIKARIAFLERMIELESCSAYPRHEYIGSLRVAINRLQEYLLVFMEIACIEKTFH